MSDSNSTVLGVVLLVRHGDRQGMKLESFFLHAMNLIESISVHIHRILPEPYHLHANGDSDNTAGKCEHTLSVPPRPPFVTGLLCYLNIATRVPAGSDVTFTLSERDLALVHLWREQFHCELEPDQRSAVFLLRSVFCVPDHVHHLLSPCRCWRRRRCYLQLSHVVGSRSIPGELELYHPACQ